MRPSGFWNTRWSPEVRTCRQPAFSSVLIRSRTLTATSSWYDVHHLTGKCPSLACGILRGRSSLTPRGLPSPAHLAVKVAFLQLGRRPWAGPVTFRDGGFPAPIPSQPPLTAGPPGGGGSAKWPRGNCLTDSRPRGMGPAKQGPKLHLSRPCISTPFGVVFP